MSPRFSKLAPKKLSNNIPTTPARLIIGVHCHDTTPANAADHATKAAAMHPANVPSRLMAPLVPGGTGPKPRINRGCADSAWPSSLETVSAAASARTAIAPTISSVDWRGNAAAASAHRPAPPRLASTCRAFRPPSRSATPRLDLRSARQRVASMVNNKTAKSGKNAHRPAAYISRNAVMAPIRAPPSVMAPTARARTAKLTEIIAAGKAPAG